MKIDKFNRRMFLQGAGKLAIAIPFLNSLAGRAYASGAIPPRFIFMSAQNGGQQDFQWYPSVEASIRHDLYAGRSYHTGAINFSPATGISPIFDQKFNSFVPKMNFVRGLDQRFGNPFGNHKGAALLGNIASSHATMGFAPHIPTIDQIMAFAENFYPGGAVGYIRSISINPLKDSHRHTAYNFANPKNKTGVIQSSPFLSNPKVIFDRFFEGTAAVSGGSTTPLVDGVLADYRRVASSSKLDSVEKRVLDSVIERFADLETRLTTDVTPNVAQCRGLTAPESIESSNGLSEADERRHLDLINDILVMALQCGRTRLANFHFNRAKGIEDGNSHSAPSWHWSSHNAEHGDQVAIDKLTEVYKWIADNALHPLVTRMEQITESNGQTMLDNSLVHFSTSSSGSAHSRTDLPTLLFGSAGGFFETGKIVDYRNRTVADGQGGFNEFGILHNQYLANVMYAMGLKKADWNMNSLGLSAPGFPANAEGYGWYKQISGASNISHYDVCESSVNAPLPGLVRTSSLSRFI